MTRNMKHWSIIGCAAIATSFLTMVAYSDFAHSASSSTSSTISAKKSEKVACAYIGSGNKSKLYTIEDALKVAAADSASNTVFVIPGAYPTIEENCTLSTEDTLILPYENEDYKRDLSNITDTNVSSITNASFSDNDSSTVGNIANKVVGTKLKSNVTIASNVTFTNKGTIIVGGQLGVGAGSQRPSGHTNGLYAQFLLGDGAKIQNNGSIECYGYIKGTSANTTAQIINSSGSSFLMPLVINDYKGGSFSSASNSESVFPFSIFEFPNCQVENIFNQGASMNVCMAVYASSKLYVPDNSKIIGNSSSLFVISSGNISMKYVSYAYPYTINDTSSNQSSDKINKIKIKMNGSISLGSMTLSLAGTSLKTSKFHVPLSYKFDIECPTGSKLSLPNKTKFLSGAKVTIDEDADVSISAETIFYQTYADQNTLISGLYPKNLGPAKFINNGSLTINSGFAGFLDTTGTTGKLTTGSSFSASVTTTEIMTASSGGMKYTKRKITGYGYGNIKTSKTGTYSSAQFNASSSYSSDTDGWIGAVGSSTVSEIISDAEDASCVLYSSVVMMADGSYKEAGMIRVGDIIMSLNHETGRLEPTRVIINDDVDKEAKLYHVVHLTFENGCETDFIYEHGYFDCTLNKYIYLHESDAEQYIGHEFISFESFIASAEKTKLIDVEVRELITRLCSPATANNLDFVVDGMLSMPGGLSGLFNIFEYESDSLAFDNEKKQKDIEKYGLLDYDSFKELIPEELFDLLPCKYIAASIGKGYITWQVINEYVNKWKNQLISNI